MANSGRVVRLPVHTGEALHRLLRDVHRLEEQLGVTPSLEAVAAGNGLRVDQVSGLLRLAPEPLSISQSVGDDGPELAAVLADRTARSPDDAAVAALLPAEIARLLAVLDGRDRKVVVLRFGLDGQEPRSLEAVANALGLSRQAVRQSQARALRALRRAALASPEIRELLIG
jgi:RNA polymerase sigma factor (sigma-70 family)